MIYSSLSMQAWLYYIKRHRKTEPKERNSAENQKPNRDG